MVLTTAAANGHPSPPHLVGRKHKDAADTRRRTSADGADGPTPVTCSELHAGRLGRRSRQDTGSKSFERRQVRELSPQVVGNCVQTTTATPSEGKTASQKIYSPGPGAATNERFSLDQNLNLVLGPKSSSGPRFDTHHSSQGAEVRRRGARKLTAGTHLMKIVTKVKLAD